MFLFVGILAAGGGFVWRWGAADRADACRERNVMAEVFGNATESCPTTTPAIIAMVIGGVFFVLGVALAAGAANSRQA